MSEYGYLGGKSLNSCPNMDVLVGNIDKCPNMDIWVVNH